MPTLDLHDLPLPARALICVAVALGTAAVALAIPGVIQWTRGDLIACLAFAAGIVATEECPIRLRFRTETLNFSLTEALVVGALINARPSVLTLSFAGGL